MKYIVDIPDGVEWGVVTCRTDDGFYTRDFDSLEELNSDYINEHFGSLQDEAYQAGLNDAWEAAKKIAQEWEENSDTEHRVVIDDSIRITLDSMTAQEAIDKIKAYEDKHSGRIEVGDEVIWTTDNITLIVTSMYEVGGINWCDGVAQDGKVYSTLIEKDRKTGKHYDIQSILEEMRTHD